jgi:hypothetical protein
MPPRINPTAVAGTMMTGRPELPGAGVGRPDQPSASLATLMTITSEALASGTRAAAAVVRGTAMGAASSEARNVESGLVGDVKERRFSRSVSGAANGPPRSWR